MRPHVLRLSWRAAQHHRNITITTATPLQARLITTRPATFANIRYELLARPPKTYYDYLTPTNSHLLDVTLADQLPPIARPHAQPPGASSSDLDHWTLPEMHDGPSPSRLSALLPPVLRPNNYHTPLPQGHHLVYFPPTHPTSALLPDGTDTDQWPGHPFTRRLWAGGSVNFAVGSSEGQGGDHPALRLDGRRAVCVEKIEDVRLSWAKSTTPKPEEDAEGQAQAQAQAQAGVPAGQERQDVSGDKIFVDVVRHYGSVADEEAGDPSAAVEKVTLSPAITERRTLVFLKEDGGQARQKKQEKPRDAPRTSTTSRKTPILEIPLTPTPPLLFRFSALSFNAHAIHLDRSHAISAEGYRERLVHGPLLLVLMFSALQAALRTTKLDTTLAVAGLDYRNLEPLYVSEELMVRVARGKTRWDVWVEGPGGRMCVKGSAQVVSRELVH